MISISLVWWVLSCVHVNGTDGSVRFSSRETKKWKEKKKKNFFQSIYVDGWREILTAASVALLFADVFHSGWLDGVHGETPYAVIIRFWKWNHPSPFYYRASALLSPAMEGNMEMYSKLRSLDKHLSLSCSPLIQTRHRFIECRVNHPSQPSQSEWKSPNH